MNGINLLQAETLDSGASCSVDPLAGQDTLLTLAVPQFSICKVEIKPCLPTGVVPGINETLSVKFFVVLHTPKGNAVIKMHNVKLYFLFVTLKA